MIKEYLKLTFRHIRRRKGLAVINIGGLAIGMAACILVLYFIRDEYSFDRFHTHIDSIYEVKSFVSYSGNSPVFLETQGPVAPTLAEDFMEVEAASRLAAVELIVQSGEKIFKQKGIGVDPSFFTAFNLSCHWRCSASNSSLRELREPRKDSLSFSRVVNLV